MKTLRLLRNLSMRQLRVFLSAAKHGSFSKAATELSLTAPAVSMQMKELEGELGMALGALDEFGLALFDPEGGAVIAGGRDEVVLGEEG